MARTRTISDARLLEAAREVFIERGFAAPTKDVAGRAGVSEGVLFQRYPTKAELFFAAMVLPAPDLGDLVRARTSKGLIHLRQIALAMTDYFRATMPVLVPLMAHPGFQFEEFARRHPNSPLDALRRELVTFLAEERNAGRIGRVDPGAAALLVFSVAECVAFFERMGAHGGQMPPELIERAMECLWNGLTPRLPERKAKLRAMPHRRARGRRKKDVS
jgi:AcrR family transcriptional regulator